MMIPVEVALLGEVKIKEYIKLKEEVQKLENEYDECKKNYNTLYKVIDNKKDKVPSSPQFMSTFDLMIKGSYANLLELQELYRELSKNLSNMMRLRDLILIKNNHIENFK